jgi:hypothetical protein
VILVNRPDETLKPGFSERDGHWFTFREGKGPARRPSAPRPARGSPGADRNDRDMTKRSSASPHAGECLVAKAIAAPEAGSWVEAMVVA